MKYRMGVLPIYNEDGYSNEDHYYCDGCNKIFVEDALFECGVGWVCDDCLTAAEVGEFARRGK